MERGDFFYQAFTKILHEELVPAMGCTEPIALAYAAAKARDILGKMPDRAVVQASGSIIKNVKSVIVPNTNHLKGIPAAVCAGIIAGDADSELEVLANVSPEKINQIKTYMENTDVQVLYLDSGLTFDLMVTVFSEAEYAKVRISNSHTNIVLIEKNHETLLEIPVRDESDEGFTDRSVLSVKKSGNTYPVSISTMCGNCSNARSTITPPSLKKVCAAATAPISDKCCCLPMAMISRYVQRPKPQLVLMPE